MKLSIIVLITINTLTSVAFGQTRYIKTIEGSIVDTSTYAKLKAEKVEKIKSIMQTKDYDPTKYGTYLEQLGIKYPTLSPQ